MNTAQVRDLHRRITSMEKAMNRLTVSLRDVTKIVRQHDKQLGFPGDHKEI